MKGKRVIAAILLVGILAATLAGCKNEDISKKETEKPVITLGSDNYPPYNYLNEDGIPTGIDVELATEAFKRMVSGGRCPDQLGEEKGAGGERGDRLYHGLFFHGRTP